MPVRSLMIPLTVADDAQYHAVLGSLRRVRAAARQAYGVFFAAQAAGADISVDAEGACTVRPSTDRAKAILSATMGKEGKAPAYELREWVLRDLLVGYRSFVWDDLRRRIWTRWQARDPEFPRAGAGWLSLQNMRGLAAFRNTGIGFPACTLAKDTLAAHRVTLTWCEIGPVEFRVGDLDPGRWFWWRRIADRTLDHGTVILNERDGRLSLLVPYEVAGSAAPLEPDRRLVVRVEAERLIITGPDGGKTADGIDLTEARDWCARLRAQQDAWDRRRGCVGSPRKPWGEPKRFRGIAEHQHRLTETRRHGARGRNHAWAKRIATRAADWRCGTVEWQSPEESALCGHPWEWSNFFAVLRHKVEAAGATTVLAAA